MSALTRLAHSILASHLKSGDVAVDLTAGNGFDTWFLARKLGPTDECMLSTFSLTPSKRPASDFETVDLTALQLSLKNLMSRGNRESMGKTNIAFESS